MARVGPRPKPTPERDQSDYFRWSSDRLAALLQSHFDRRARNESKAAGIVAVVNILAGFVLMRGTSAPPGSSMAVGLVVLRILALLGMAATLACWFQAVRAVDFRGPNPDAFDADDNASTMNDFPFRYRRVRDNLLKSLRESLPIIEARGRWVQRCEAASGGTFAILFVLILLEFLA